MRQFKDAFEAYMQSILCTFGGFVMLGVGGADEDLAAFGFFGFVLLILAVTRTIYAIKYTADAADDAVKTIVAAVDGVGEAIDTWGEEV